jgi:hypothetical protein
LERAMGFEPTTASLEGWNSTTELRPPYYFLRSRIHHAQSLRCTCDSPTHEFAGTSEALYGGQARIRTLEDISQQIYSLPPLATWVPARDVSLFYPTQIEAQR